MPSEAQRLGPVPLRAKEWLQQALSLRPEEAERYLEERAKKDAEARSLDAEARLLAEYNDRRLQKIAEEVMAKDYEKNGPTKGLVSASYPMEIQDAKGNRYMFSPGQMVDMQTGRIITEADFVKENGTDDLVVLRNAWGAPMASVTSIKPDPNRRVVPSEPGYVKEPPMIDWNDNYERSISARERRGERERASWNYPKPPTTIQPLAPLPDAQAPSWQPIGRPATMAETQVTRDGRTNPNAGKKTVLQSDVMRKWQTMLLSYSVETAFMLQLVDEIGSRIAGAPVQVDFIANTGSPIKDDTQRVSIIAKSPFPFRAMLIRALKKDALAWYVESVNADNNTPLTFNGKALNFADLAGYVRTVRFEQGTPSEPSEAPAKPRAGTPGKRKVVI